jgi:hypothetical protein
VPAVWPDSANPASVVLDGSEFREEASDFLSLKSAVPSGGNAIRSDPSAPAPPPQRVRMDMQESGHFPYS